MDAVDTAMRARPPRKLPVGRALAAAGVLIALLVAGRQLGGAVFGFAEWVKGLGPWGPVVFVLGYAAAVVLLAPAALLTLAGGAVFDLLPGVAYVFTAAVAGSAAAFLVARHAARGWVERRLQGNARFAAIDRAVGAEGRKIVFLLRLSPAFPFVFLNYALGLTRIRFVDYLLASPGMLPGTFLYVYYGRVIGDVAALAAGAAPEKGAADYALLAVGLAATLAVTWVVTRIARRALREATGG